MSASRYFEKIAFIATALMLVITVLFMNGSSLGLAVMSRTMGYENRLFDNTRVHTIDIVMDDWDEFIDNATSEEYYAAAVVIDGEVYKNVGIRGKGNTSLSTVSSMNSDRYSFKVEFDHYDNSITYHGLDKLSLNNLIQDTTMMKDYLTYTMMKEFGAYAPLCSFTYITVNGEDWGLYLAVEGVEDSFLERNFGSNYGELYKPDSLSMGGGRGNGADFKMDDFSDRGQNNAKANEVGNNQRPGMTQHDAQNDNKPFMGAGRNDFGFSIDEEALRSTFVKLGIDEKLLDGVDFENITMETVQSVISSLDEETTQKLMQEVMSSGSFKMPDMGGFGGMGSSDVKLQYIDDEISSYSNIWNNAKTDITERDQMRLIESLKKLSDKEQIESVVDVEQVIRYFVVHNYVCNGDSYTGSMIHNYYLYEEDGQMTMIPWDYNLAFGTFQGSSGKDAVNTPVDAPVLGGSGEDRPMWSWILSDESYTELYHQYYAEFINTVDVQAIIENAYNLIKSYMEKDPTAFYTCEEFEAGVETMLRFCSLRTESISLQLENGETETNMNYVDASGLDTSDMGSFGGGGGMPGRNGNRGDSEEQTSDMRQMQEGFAPSNIPEGFNPFEAQGDFGAMLPTETDGGVGAVHLENAGDADTAGNSNRTSRDNMQNPGGNFNPDTMNYGNTASDGSDQALLILSVLVLVIGLIIARLYKR